MGIDRRFRLQYFWTPLRCSHCKIFGHDFDICNVRPRTVAELEARIANAATSQVGQPGAHQGNPSGDQEQDGFELPKRRRPKKDHPKKPQNDKGKIAASSAVDVNVNIPIAPILVEDLNSIDKPDQKDAVDPVHDPVHDPAVVELGLDPGFKGANKIGDGVNTQAHQDIPTCPVLPLDTERVVRDPQSSSSCSNSASSPGCDELPTSSHHKSTTGLDDYDMFLLNRLMHPNLKREAKANVS